MKWYVVNALAGFKDFGVGALIASIIAHVYGIEASVWLLMAFLVFGSVMAVLPDFDIIIPILRKKVTGNHRLTLMHRPLLLLPVATTIGFALGGQIIAVTVFTCVLWHFTHDSYGGGSIGWLWPFSDKM